MSSPPDRDDVEPVPSDQCPTGAQRDAAAARLSAARGRSGLTLAEFCDRLDAVYTADTVAVLHAAADELPAGPPVGIAAAPMSSVFGDLVVAGRWRAGEVVRVGTVFGDTKVDLRSMISDEADLRDVEVHARTTFGNVVVTVPDGVEVELLGKSVFGDRKIELAPVPRIPGTPIIRIHAQAIFGDVQIRSAGIPTAGAVWRALLDRVLPPPRPPG